MENSLQNVTNETIIEVVNNLTTLVTTSKNMNKGETLIALTVLEAVAHKPDLVPSKPNKIQELGKVKELVRCKSVKKILVIASLSL